MTEQEKQALAGLCRIEIKRWKACADYNPNMRYMVALMEVALSSLTADIGWIKCIDSLPENKPGEWSEEVAAVSDIGGLFKISCMGGYWQRTAAFIESGATSITHWQPLPTQKDEL